MTSGVPGTVVIAGAGPVGLMLAGELRRAGIETVVVERLVEPVRWPRSLFIQNRSMEVLDQRGLDWFSESPRWRNYNFGFLNLGRLRDDSEFVPRYAPQHEFERLLEERAADLGAEIRRGHEVVAVDQDVDGVTVGIRAGSEDYRLRAAYLVGCDGGRSSVRKLAGIDFPGTSSTLSGITAWLSLNGEQFPGGVQADIHPTGIFAIAQLEPGLFRATTIEFDTEPDRATEVTVEELRDAGRRIAGIDLDVNEVHWISRFGNATRIAARYRAGRVLLAGDAAHIHFASAAQGLNTGVQDAVNLGWKLAAAVQGWAPPGLLDTYHDERHPIGERVCMYSQAQVALYHPLDEVGPLRALLDELFQLEDVSRHLLELSTGVGIRYRMAGDRDAADRHPLLGCRMPDVALTSADGPRTVFEALREGRGVVLVADGAGRPAELSGWQDRLAVHSVAEAALGASVVLVRPDGYVAYVDPAGVDHDGLRSALARWFGEPPHSGAAVAINASPSA
jgi:bifunctional hydroxylase/dehydrase